MGARWTNASRVRPCGICAKTDWCSRLGEGDDVLVEDCHRQGEPSAIFFTYADGTPTWRHTRRSGHAGLPARADAEPELEYQFERADADTLNRVYTRLLELAPLYEDHGAALVRRGFAVTEAHELGYRSYPDDADRRRIVDALVAEFGAIHLLHIPGFDAPERSSRLPDGTRINTTELDLSGDRGLLLPVRDVGRRISGMVIRRDGGDEPRYLPLTSRTYAGSRAEIGHHHSGDLSASPLVRVIEGVIKADLTRVRTGIPAVGVPSGSRWLDGARHVGRLLPDARVLLAPDADRPPIPGIAHAVYSATDYLASEGRNFAIETWPEALELKGLDDVVAAGRHGEVSVRSDVWNVLRALLGDDAPPKLGARLLLERVIERIETEPHRAMGEGVTRAVALLGTSVEASRIQTRIQTALRSTGRWRDFSVQVRSESKKISRSELEQRARLAGRRAFHRGDETELREAVHHELTGGQLDRLVFAEGHLFLYCETTGIWDLLPTERVIDLVTTYAGSPVGSERLMISAGRATGVHTLLCAHVSRPGFFDAASAGITFKNGFLVVDQKTGERTLKGHSPTHRARLAYPFLYEEGSRPKTYVAFLARLCDDKIAEERAATIACLTEHLGACIAGMATTFERAIFCWGDGGTGNSTILKIHCGVMPLGSVCCILPEHCEDKFRLAVLAGKLLNAIDDLPKGELRNAGLWKSTITGGEVQAEHKHKDPFRFTPKAGNLVMLNELPPTSDTTGGFARRPIVLRFTSPIRPDEKNRNFARELLEAETPAIVSYALERLSEAIKQNALTVPPSSDGYVAEWVRTSSPFTIYFEEHVAVLKEPERADPNAWTRAGDAYQHYASWARETGHGPMSATTFGKELKKKLGVTPADAKVAPYKRAEGNFYPIRVRGSIKDRLIEHANDPAQKEAEDAVVRAPQNGTRTPDERRHADAPGANQVREFPIAPMPFEIPVGDYLAFVKECRVDGRIGLQINGVGTGIFMAPVQGEGAVRKYLATIADGERTIATIANVVEDGRPVGKIVGLRKPDPQLN